MVYVDVSRFVMYCFWAFDDCIEVFDAVYVGLMGLFEKRRFRSFLQYVDEYDPSEPKTFKGFDTKQKTMKECYEKFGLDENTADFTGHALALYLNDELVTVTSLSVTHGNSCRIRNVINVKHNCRLATLIIKRLNTVITWKVLSCCFIKCADTHRCLHS